MKKQIGIVVTLLALGGCASSEPLAGATPTDYGPNNGGAFNVAVYRHPQTGDVKRCEHTLGFFWWSGPVAYGECKSKLEAQGYVREAK